jgi:mono/diheme cytochrome c family protein
MKRPPLIALLLLPLFGCAGSAVPAAQPPVAPDQPTVVTVEKTPEPPPVVVDGNARTARDMEDDKWSPIQSDFPFQASVMTVPYPAGNTTNKAISIRLPGNAAVAFDTDLLRMSAGWTGGFLSPTGVTFDTSHGGHPQMVGEQQFGNAPGPGWADAKGTFDDPRAIPFGPLPDTWVRWSGLTVLGDTVVLGYTVHGIAVREQPAAITEAGITGFVRNFELQGKAKGPALKLRVADLPADAKIETGTVDGASIVTATSNNRITRIGASALPGSKFEILTGGRVVLHIPRPAKKILFKVVVASAPDANPITTLPGLDGAVTIADAKAGGTRHWPEPIITRGVKGEGPGPYVVDRITTPYPGVYKGQPADWRDNKFSRRIMFGGLDFFSDGTRAAVSTWEGDVWIVEGIDDDLAELRWHRFASGLFEPLGLKIVGDVVYVTGRDQLTRLVDTNGDGEADRYENFNNQATNSPGFHEFTFDLQTDAKGNFYTAKAGPVRGGGRDFGGGGGNGTITPFAGALHKITKDGKMRTVVATGFRAPNGIGIGPEGQITAGDNEGTWMPTSPIHWVRQGGYQGVEPLAHRTPLPPYDPPLCYIAKSYDNSGGNQVWVPKGDTRWGPFAGEMLHFSYGRAAIYLVLKEPVPGGNKPGSAQMQGGIVRLFGGADANQMTGQPLKLTSSAMRGRFNARDGQLYVAGLSGWQSDAVSLTGFDRIRYTGAPVQTVRGLKVVPTGVELRFSEPLDPASVDAQNFSGERWNYVRTKEYGSPEFSVEDPTRHGHDRLEVAAVVLGKDNQTVTLHIEDMKPVHQMLLRYNLKTLSGAAIRQSVMHTVHFVPKGTGPQEALVAQNRGKPGLLLHLRGADGNTDADLKTVRNVALYTGPGVAPTPFIAGGKPYHATWEGTLTPDMKGQFKLRAYVTGKLTVSLDDKVVLSNESNAETLVDSSPVELDKRAQNLRVVLQGSANMAAGVRLQWAQVPDGEGTQLSFEPITAQHLRYQPTDALKEAELRRQGRAVFVENRCANCHVDAKQRQGLPELSMSAPGFAGIGSRRNWAWMLQKILDPGRSGNMPRLLSGKEGYADATLIASYLGTLTDAATEKVQKENHRAVLAAQASAPKYASLQDVPTIAELQCGSCHTVEQMASEDGRIGLDGLLSKFPEGALTEFLMAPEHNHADSRMPNFGFSRREAVELEAILRRPGGWTPKTPERPLDAASLDRGKTLVQQLGCLSCHTGPAGLTNQARAPILTASALQAGKGCLGETPPANYKMPAGNRTALLALGASGYDAIFGQAPIEFAERQIETLRCNSCHGRVEGFPNLDVAGEKLRPEWVTAFVSGKIPYKPRGLVHPDGHTWLSARMPAFPSRATRIAEGFAGRSGYAASTPVEKSIDAALAQSGAKLVSSDGGFACIGCHGVGAQKATQVFEVEGINLAYSVDRLRPDYFARWLRNPMKVDPQTKMPAYFDESGMSPLDTVLGGKADAQIDAIWNYLRTIDIRNTKR